MIAMTEKKCFSCEMKDKLFRNERCYCDELEMGIENFPYCISEEEMLLSDDFHISKTAQFRKVLRGLAECLKSTKELSNNDNHKKNEVAKLLKNLMLHYMAFNQLFTEYDRTLYELDHKIKQFETYFYVKKKYLVEDTDK